MSSVCKMETTLLGVMSSKKKSLNSFLYGLVKKWLVNSGLNNMHNYFNDKKGG